ncbi:hypothetical protein D3C86_1692480 [compost metagenome]
MALLEEGDVFITPDETHVRHIVDEGLGIAQHLLLDLVGPELLGNLEVLVDGHGLADVDAAVGGLRRVVELAECRMAGTGIVPGVGAFLGDLVQALVDINRPARFQLVEVSPQARAHDAATDQQHIHSLFRLVLLGAANGAQVEEHQQDFFHKSVQLK